MKRLAIGGVVLAVALAAAWGLARSVRKGLQQPNVVLIIGCTVRRDQLGAYGGPKQVTPFLTARARSGAVFEHGVTAAPWTKAASSALLSGRHPATIGMVEPGPKPSRRKLPDAVTTVAEHFQANGYQTFGATANPNLNEVFGFGQGYDAYVEGTNLWRLGGKSKVHGNHLIESSMKVLKRVRDDRPLFASIMFTDAHAPATVTPAEKALIHEAGLPDRVITYRAMLARFDRAVALWVKELRGIGVRPRNTVFAVVNDHGEGLHFPRHHGLGHGNFTYPSTIRMPWILWGNGVATQRIGGMASQIDVFPTLAGLAGLPATPATGQDWSAQVRGESKHTTRTVAFADTWFQTARRSGVYSSDTHCHGDWHTDGEPACFSDERAEHRLESGQASRLVQSLQDFRSEMEQAFTAYEHTENAEPPASVQEQLEALGYVDGGEGTVP